MSLCITKYIISKYKNWKNEHYNWKKIWNKIMY